MANLLSILVAVVVLIGTIPLSRYARRCNDRAGYAGMLLVAFFAFTVAVAASMGLATGVNIWE